MALRLRFGYGIPESNETIWLLSPPSASCCWFSNNVNELRLFHLEVLITGSIYSQNRMQLQLQIIGSTSLNFAWNGQYPLISLKTDPNSLRLTYVPGPFLTLWPYHSCLKLDTLSLDTPFSTSDRLCILQLPVSASGVSSVCSFFLSTPLTWIIPTGIWLNVTVSGKGLLWLLL